MKPLLIVSLFIIAVIFPAGISNWGLTESSEARYAEISRETFSTGNYIEPKLLGIHHYHKPPLTYYITSLGYFIFGVNEYGARMLLQIALLFQLLLVYKIAALLYHDNNLSIAATLIYFSYPIVQVAAKNLTTDAYLTTFIFSSIYCFLKYCEQNRSVKYLYLFYIFCSLSFLTKGPVGVLPQVLFAIVYTRIFKIKSVFTIHTIAALLLGVAISASWFIILLIKNENLLNYFLKYQLVDRVATDAFKRSKPFWYYFAFIPLLGLPAFVYFADYVRTNFSSLKLRRNAAVVLVLTLSVLFIVFTASSSKLILYVLPLYLFITIVSAKYLSTISLTTAKVFEKISLVFGCFLFAILIAACFIPLPLAFPKLPVIAVSTAGIFLILAFYGKRFTTYYLKAPFMNAVSIAVLTFTLPFIMKANELQINSVKPLAAFIKERSKNKSTGSIAVYDYLLPSLSFYTGKKIITLSNGNSIAERETQFETNEHEWQNTYFKLSEINDTLMLSSLLQKPNSYIITLKKNPLPDSLFFLKKNLPHEIIMGKWLIYF